MEKGKALAIYQETSWIAREGLLGNKIEGQGCRERRVSWLGLAVHWGKAHGRRAEGDGGAEGL
ncbi:MAG: hypothetical protein ABC585_06185 [Candidatus Methanosuratincola petrocarbonis]